MRAQVRRIETDFPISDLDHQSWDRAGEIRVGTYWSGEPAPNGRHFRVRLLWSDAALYVRFEAVQTEPFVISPSPNRESKTIGLWDRDVCEIFVAPDPEEPRRYHEFEIAPTGEWLDLTVHQLPERRDTDWLYDSEMASAARIGEGTSVMAIRVDWKSVGIKPRSGLKLKGNLFRCVGSGPARGYLAWSPTQTSVANFHVPERFGEFVLVDP